MKIKPDKAALDEMLRQITETRASSAQECALLCAVITATAHIIEYPPHWQINAFAGRLDRILSEQPARKSREVRDGKW